MDVLKAGLAESQIQFAAFVNQHPVSGSHEFLLALRQRAQERVNHSTKSIAPHFYDKEKIREWRDLKFRIDNQSLSRRLEVFQTNAGKLTRVLLGQSLSRDQKKNIKAFFINSLPTPKPRELPKPPEDEPGLVAVYAKLSTAIVPRKPQHIPPHHPPRMPSKSKASGGKSNKNSAPVAKMPTPEHTSSDGSEDGSIEAEPAQEVINSIEAESKKKAPVAKMIDKAVPVKRKSDGKPVKESTAKSIQLKDTTSKDPANSSASTGAAEPRPKVEPASSADPTAFSTPIFEIFVGKDKHQFSAHQAIISQSPVLKALCDGQANKKGRHKTCILLPHEKMANFGFLLGYLYSGSVLVDIPVNENDSEEAFAKAAQRLAKLYCVGAAYEMDELMSFVIKKLKEAKLWEKMPGMDFFELSEKLYPEETEAAATDEYAKFFAQHAPAMIKTVPEGRVGELMRMVSSGGAYAEAIFVAFTTAARMGPPAPKGPEPNTHRGMQAGATDMEAKLNGMEINGGRAHDHNEEIEGHQDKKIKTDITMEDDSASETAVGTATDASMDTMVDAPADAEE